MRRYADTLNITISNALVSEGMTGFYEGAARTILIDRQLIYCQKRCTSSTTTGSIPTPPEQANTAHA